MKKYRGMAIITVLLLSGVILTFVLGGLSVASQHLFQVSAQHNRHRALCAAEVGVSKAQFQLEQNLAFAGPITGSLEDGASFQVAVSHQASRAIVQSTGMASGQSQRLRVTLSLDAETYRGLSTEGPVSVHNNGYINGIRSLLDTRSSRGNMFTQSNLTVDNSHKLSVTGLASVAGSITGVVYGQTNTCGSPSAANFTKASLLATSFPNTTVPGSGIVAANTKISGDLDLNQVLHIPAGMVVHVTGDCILNRGVTGEGTLVVDGNALLRGGENLRNDTPKGVLLYTDGDVLLAHPSAYVDDSSSDGWVTNFSSVGDLFAAMPEEIPYLLSQRLPPGAPSNVSFFQWYDSQNSAPTPAFLEWKNGDGTDVNPGLRPDVIAWLDQAGAMHAAIQAVAP
ncbi:hypothetical protein IV102_18380 [bacterium]|nr:hypothetical protein [bacterium]